MQYEILFGIGTLLIGITTIVLAVRSTKREDAEKSILYAPLLQVNSYSIRPPDKYRKKSTQKNPPDFKRFSLDRRTFNKANGWETCTMKKVLNMNQGGSTFMKKTFLSLLTLFLLIG
ncbi:MAG: hypothetical protein LBS96_10280, partial [Oscillospiraceae bacterium]|nr:hypothetical protein [Oscillospiraceae bacterium]